MPENEPQPKVFFGIEQKEKYYLPETNKEQWIEVKKLKAAKLSEYFNKLGALSTAVKQEDGSYEFVPDTGKIGELNKILMDISVIGYNIYLMQDGQAVLKTGWDSGVWQKMYNTMEKTTQDELLEVIKKLNPSLQEEKKKTNKTKK